MHNLINFRPTKMADAQVGDLVALRNYDATRNYLGIITGSAVTQEKGAIVSVLVFSYPLNSKAANCVLAIDPDELSVNFGNQWVLRSDFDWKLSKSGTEDRSGSLLAVTADGTFFRVTSGSGFSPYDVQHLNVADMSLRRGALETEATIYLRNFSIYASHASLERGDPPIIALSSD